jgi:hypothetical protein
MCHWQQRKGDACWKAIAAALYRLAQARPDRRPAEERGAKSNSGSSSTSSCAKPSRSHGSWPTIPPDISTLIPIARLRAVLGRVESEGQKRMNALHRARTRDLEGGVPVAETLFLLIPMENEPGRRQALFGRRSVNEGQSGKIIESSLRGHSMQPRMRRRPPRWLHRCSRLRQVAPPPSHRPPHWRGHCRNSPSSPCDRDARAAR